MRDCVLAILAHPDDTEFLCAGSMIRLQREHGWEIHIASMTPGDCGSMDHPPEEISRIRRGEGKAAAESIRGIYHCLEERDLRVIFSEAVIEKVVRLMNKLKPRIIITHSSDDYHLDHEETSKAVRAAAFAAPIPNFLHGRHDDPPLEQIPHLYYCDPVEGKDLFGRPIEPSFRIDVSGVMADKEAMLASHHSQRAWLQLHHGVDNFVESMREWGATQGSRCGVTYAEGFRQHLGHSFPQDNLLGDLLGTV